MDSKTIGKIVSANNETDKVMNKNSVVWEKLVTWEKWSVKEIKSYGIKKSSSEVRITDGYMSSYRNYKIDNEGNFIGVERDIYYGSWLIYDYKRNSAFNYNKKDTTGNVYEYIGYWYQTYVTSSKKEKDKLIDTVSAPEGTYPDNGIKDGFWYVKKK